MRDTDDLDARNGATHAIDVRGLVKRYGRATVLKGLGLAVRRGEVHAFLGPNGAGKTTTLRLLLGLLRRDGGSMRVLGFDPWSDAPAVHRRVSYVPGDVALWPNLTGGEVIDLLARLRGAPDPARRDALIARFELDPTRASRTYSKGNRQKVALIAALASDVDLYILDEPTSGLDPLMEAAFRDTVSELRRAGKTVLLSSHILSEAEALADRVSIIRAGEVVESGTLGELRHLTRTTVTAELEREPPELASLAGVYGLRIAGRRVSAEVDGAGLNPFVAALTTAGLRALTCQPPTLEELFLRHYKTEASAATSAATPGGAS